jgi:hypothetical protein
LPDDLDRLRHVLVLAAPLVTIVSAVLWILLSSWAMKKVNMWHVSAAIAEAQGMVDDCNKHGTCTVEEMQNLQNALVALRAIKLDVITGNVTDVRARLKEINL